MATRIQLQTLKSITNDFSDDHKIGSGGYGNVYKAVYKGEEMAVKLLKVDKRIDDQLFMNELSNHMKVQHPNIVRLVGYCNEDTKEYVKLKDGTSIFRIYIHKVLCFEYMQGRSLDKRLCENSLGDDWHTHYQIIKGTCEGLFYLHRVCEPPILHLDLKPANILLDKSMKPKIADFGLSRIYSTDHTHLILGSVAGTIKYMAPELIQSKQISEMTDVFSLGVTIMDVIKRSNNSELDHHVWDTKFVEDVCAYWGKRDRKAHLYQVKTCTEIAIRCVHGEKKNRPTIEDIMADLNGTGTQVSSKGLHTLTVNSSSGTFSPLPSSNAARGPLDVVIVYAFDCSAWTPAWYAVDEIFWLVQGKLTKFTDSCLGYIYVMLSGNTYTFDMKIVDSAETSSTGYTPFDRRRVTCYKNMASGLSEAHKMISNRGYENGGIILLFSDGLEYKGDFFQGAENFASKVPVHTFTFDEGDTYNHVLRSIAAKSPGGRFHTTPVPERPTLSTAFSRLLDNIFGGNPEYDEIPPRPISGRGPLDVVIVYAFDCTNSTPAWHTMDRVFWLVQEKLTHIPDSCMGYIYVMSTPNTYTSDMKLVDPDESMATGYTAFAKRSLNCTKNMASGLPRAHKMIRNRGHHNGIILFFSDGLTNKGDFFDGTENFVSKVPVHTFTLGGDAYNHGLQAIAKNSPGGTFNPLPVPERPQQSEPFSELLDRLLSGTMKN